MRFLHISDLHIGKRMHEFSLEEDQRHILSQILEVADAERPDAVLIAGDVYDTSSPSADSMTMLDVFLTALSERCKVFVTPGNHDSAERLAFGSRMFSFHGVHIAHPFDGKAERHILERGGERVDVYLLPYLSPRIVRRQLPDAEISSYGDAVAAVLDNSDISGGRKVLVAHQFVIGAERSDSETFAVGNIDSMPASVFDGFDYVALGHIHTPQDVGPNVRYCGSPLKYSKSEADREKSVTVVDIDDKVTVRTVPLRPLRDVRVVTGSLEDVILQGKSDPHPEDFIYAVLNEEPTDGMARLREVYPNTVSMETPMASFEETVLDDMPEGRIDVMELFTKVYEDKTGISMTESQISIIQRLMEGSE